MAAIVLLTDFGLADHYTGVLHAVLAREAPGSPRIDLTHGVAPGDVWGGAFRLRCAWSYLAEDAVVLAVVDPGVGGPRRAVAARVGRRWVVGPDNGLVAAAGAVEEVVVLDPALMGLPTPSATFHGRDLFAPAAARLARGDAPSAVGRPGVARLEPCPLPEPVRQGGDARGAVWHVDRFGNVVTNLPAAWFPADRALRLTVAGRSVSRRVRTYGEAPPGEPVLLEGSSGLLELAVNQGSAADLLGCRRGEEVATTPGGPGEGGKGGA